MWKNRKENDKWKQNNGLIANLMYFPLNANKKHETCVKKKRETISNYRPCWWACHKQLKVMKKRTYNMRKKDSIIFSPLDPEN